jgi:uncharacterized Zn ribbon protein
MSATMKEKLSFKTFLLEAKKKESKQPEKVEANQFKIGDSVKVIKAFKVGKDNEIGLGEVFQIKDIAENGDLQLANAWGVEDQAKFIVAKHFEKVS